jgi:parallel beta-helix repeat protein
MLPPKLRSVSAARLITLLLLVAAPARAQNQRLPTVELRHGLVVTSSVRVFPRLYRLVTHPSTDSAALIIRGDDITVDFAGATLDGMPAAGDPDLAQGVGIRIEGGTNVRILNARIRGFRIGILATGTRQLSLSGNDLSHNWKPRLFSLVEHESLADWLSFHQNEKREWMRFGAAIYLEDVRGGEVRSNRVVQGMNALLMTRTDSILIRDNEFAFNSGLGIGLYRSSDNTIVRNRLDFNVRGYSHGFYRRGQDSADLLFYEQSQRNVVAFNSATHGGDGVFLWAGQSTMDSGQGGANDNWFVANDFSFAPTNSMEATFSRNHFVSNLAQGSEYGLWGGYSYSSVVTHNCFRRNRIGVAIEHGQDNRITGNRFDGDSTALSLWANPTQPADWGYPRHRDTRSMRYEISDNLFSGNRVALRAVNTSEIRWSGNRAAAVESLHVLRDTARFTDSGTPSAGRGRQAGVATDPCAAPPRLDVLPADVRERAVSAGRGIPSTPLARRDRSSIIVGEWGPFDWRSPMLWPIDSTHKVPLRVRVIGPPGNWRIATRRGVERVSRQAGRVGDTVLVTPHADSTGDWEVTLEYRGGATTSPRGETRAAGVAVPFGYGRFEPPITWDVRFVTWSDSADPRTNPAAFAERLRGTPLLTRREVRLDYQWFRPAIRELPQARWALEATGRVTLPEGRYTLRTISDDGIRVWVDGRLVIDNWSLHGSEVDLARLDGGSHDLRVQFFQIEGWTELRLDIVRGEQRSRGSPGPH